MKPISDDPNAPFGLEEDGTAKAPYGFKNDGTPRRSAGGRTGAGPRPPKRRTTSAPIAGTPSKLTQSQKREQLVSLTNMFVVNGLVAAAMAPPVGNIIGEDQAMALAGDAVIVKEFAPAIADGLVGLSETHPNILAWMDGISDKAPYLVLLTVGMQMGKMMIQNHARPDVRLARAGAMLGALNAAAMAEEVERQAAEAGLPTAGPIFDQEAAGEPAAA